MESNISNGVASGERLNKMSAFSGALKIEQDATTSMVRLLEPLIWRVGYAGSPNRIIIPADGTWFDGLSMPIATWWLGDRMGSGLRAGIAHDYLTWMIELGTPHKSVTTQAEADWLLREMLRACRFGLIRRNIMYIGVKLGSRYPVLAKLGKL